MKRLVFLAATVVLFAAAPRADAPGVYAIRGARIVAVSGAPIESGTVVIRRGRIEAAGASAAIPPDAEVVEGKGLTVYPGLIDLGNTHAADQPAPERPKNLKTTAEEERWKRLQILRPQARAADLFKLDDPEMAAVASAGITSMLSLPPGDVISGQSALVNVAASPDAPQIGDIVQPERGSLIVKTPVALHVSFPDGSRVGGSVYPESLLGVIAFVRQSFLDAQHYALEQAHYARVPSSGRPADDPALEAMQAALTRQLPVAFEANEGREILRALEMANDLKLDAIVTGARDAEEVVSDLKARNVRVIYSLNYPQRSRSLAPDADEPVRVLRERANAPRVPGALAKAGVPFAFESAGLADPRDFVKNAAKTVKAGLPAADAIRALTLGAASIAGVQDRLGSIEKGKIANLVVTDGDLFEDRTKVVKVFVDGRPIALVTPSPANSRRPAR